jgi:hypothetical protein
MLDRRTFLGGISGLGGHKFALEVGFEPPLKHVAFDNQRACNTTLNRARWPSGRMSTSRLCFGHRLIGLIRR